MAAMQYEVIPTAYLCTFFSTLVAQAVSAKVKAEDDCTSTCIRRPQSMQLKVSAYHYRPN